MADDAGGAPMANKPGWQTTELYVALLPIALIVLDKLLDLGLDRGELLAAGLAAAGYPIGRGLAKVNKG